MNREETRSPAPSRRATKKQLKLVERLRKNLPLLLAGAAAVALVVVGLVLWTATHREPPVQSQSQSADMSALEGIVVGGRVGAAPVVEVPRPVAVYDTKTRTIVAGEGREITADAPVLLSIYAYDADGGAPQSDALSGRVMLGRATADVLGDGLLQTVLGQREGSRLLVVRPLVEGGSEIVVVDILSSIAAGEPVADSGGPLTVDMTDAGPQVTHGKEPPTSLVIQTLIQGQGEQIQEADEAVVQYTALNWSDGVVVSSTWERGIPEKLDIDQVMPGIRDALTDQRVGSRLAVTIPPDSAAGDDTLVVVADILAVSRN